MGVQYAADKHIIMYYITRIYVANKVDYYCDYTVFSVRMGFTRKANQSDEVHPEFWRGIIL